MADQHHCRNRFVGFICADKAVSDDEQGTGANTQSAVKPKEPDPCQSNSCPPDRVCTDAGNGTFYCSCPAGMTGSDCETGNRQNNSTINKM